MKKNQLALPSLLIAAVVSFSVLAPRAHAAAVIWNTGIGANGHAYEYVDTALSWTDAAAAAAAMTFMGESGHLVTITTSEENDFVINLVSTEPTGGWIGATDAATEGLWEWVVGPEAGTQFWSGGPTGTALGFENWAGGQPAPSGFENEDYANLSNGSGLWADGLNAAAGFGYIVEYSIPEPSRVILGFVGMLVCLLRRQR